MSTLNKKLWREAWHLRGQLFSIALVVAAGLMAILTMRGSYDTLVNAQAQYYRDTRFADVWSYLVRAPLSLVDSLERIPGVNAVDTRVTFSGTLNFDEEGVPARGLFISLPEDGRPLLNDIVIKEGRYVSSGHYDEVIVSENFATARNLRPNDSIPVILNGRSRDLQIVGVAVAPEQSYVVPPGSLFPEDDKYGIFWMGREAMAAVYNMDGAFNEVFLSLQSKANLLAVLKQVDDLLSPYGGLGAYGRDDQVSHAIMEGELNQNKVMGTAIPTIFLLVAVFLLHLVLGRLISTQRNEIAVLKAFGYTNGEIARHFLSFALVAVSFGTLLGVLGGVYFGGLYINLYGQYFDFPNLQYRLPVSLLFVAVGACFAGALSGAWLAIKRAVDLPPAEAMRPEAPKHYSAGILEKLGISRFMSSSVRMITRNIERKPVQSFLSSLGVAMSVAILTIGLFMYSGVHYLMDLQFQVIQREDLSISFTEIVNDSVRYDLARLEGVSYVETFHSAPARLRFAHKDEELVIQGLAPDSHLRRIIDADARVVPVPIGGFAISRLLAERLEVRVGDTLEVEMLEGERRHGELAVNAIVDDFMGISAYTDDATLNQLTREQSAVSGAYLLVDDGYMNTVSAKLKEMPVIASVVSPAAMLASFEKQMDESLYVSIAFLLGFAGIIAVGVIYNGARISLSERGRELASLRVMGFRRSEVTTLLLGEQAVITVFAIPLGCVIGYWLTYLLLTSLQTDLYRVPFVVEQSTYVISAAVVIGAGLVSGLIVKRRLDRFSIVDVLKTRE
ncbi:MAG: FtsX-like permease family protein [Pseudohongiellaceae bacterium]|nr:FtsX-like permease family protein [Pseudohongiellaceae bacterium]